MILIPIKNLTNAKQRLKTVLDQGCRTALAQAMLSDVLEVLTSLPNRPAISLVTNDAFAIDLARHLGCEVIADLSNTSETDAIENATRVCQDRGAAFTLVLPGDIPLIRVSELLQILQAAPQEGSVLVPSSDNRGTNAVLRNPCGMFPLRFGNDSFVPHLAAARGTGKLCEVLSLPGIGLDIDSPSDLYELCAAPGQTRSQKLVRRWNLPSASLGAYEAAR